jgi:hypothetical protein
MLEELKQHKKQELMPIMKENISLELTKKSVRYLLFLKENVKVLLIQKDVQMSDPNANIATR